MWSWFWGPSYAWPRYGYGWPWTVPKEQEIAMLEDQERWLNRELDAIKKRLEELKK